MAMPDFTSFPSGAGVIFDMDGLMLDTERIAKIAWQQAARLAGVDMSDALFASLIGRRETDAIGLLAEAFGPEFDFHQSQARCNALYQDYVARHSLPLKAGIRELLDELSRRSIPLAVATSTQNPVARQRLEQVGLLRYFSVLVAGNEIPHGKPAPDIYLEAVKRLGVEAATSFALEDSPAGVRAAHAAGLNVIMVPDLVPPTPEIAALTWRIADSLNDVHGWLTGHAVRTG
jgi:HAD superfamily hydrolase (TIGR01509 family)